MISYQHSLEIKRIFVRYVSHEIRTPLNSAFLGLQFLLENITSIVDQNNQSFNSTIDILDEIKHSVDIAVNILDDLLIYEKLEGNIMELHSKNLRIRQLVLDSIRPSTLQVFSSRSYRFYF